jgi:hypothetical protein
MLAAARRRYSTAFGKGSSATTGSFFTHSISHGTESRSRERLTSSSSSLEEEYSAWR